MRRLGGIDPNRESGPVVFVLTTARAADLLLRGQYEWLRKSGFEVSVICSPGPEVDEIRRREGVDVHAIGIHRQISLLKDAITFVRLFWILGRLRPVAVIAGTPKAALLGSLAARCLRIKVRVCVIHGLRSETLNGVQRLLVRSAERLSCRCATDVLAVSESLLTKCIQFGIVKRKKVSVLANGHCNGIDLRRSSESHARSKSGPKTIGFVGRIVRDKGIFDLLKVHELASTLYPDLELLIVGEFEPGDPVTPLEKVRIENDARIQHIAHTDNVDRYYREMDLLVLPSYREGFPSVPLEAALQNVPTVGYEATGIVDAVLSGQTGVLVPVGDVEMLAAAVVSLLGDPNRRSQLASTAHLRVTSHFSNEVVWTAMRDFLDSKLRMAMAKAT